MNFLKILIKNHYILSAGSSTMGHTISPHPIYKVNSVKPETIDITHSPTYQYLQEERALKRKICDFVFFSEACFHYCLFRSTKLFTIQSSTLTGSAANTIFQNVDEHIECATLNFR